MLKIDYGTFKKGIRTIILRELWLVGLLWALLCSAGLQAQQVTLIEAARRNVLIRILKEQQIPFEERALFTEYGGFGFSLYIAMPQSAETESTGLVDTLVLGIPLFSAEPGEILLKDEGLPFSFEVGLAFIEAVREKERALNILVAFLGDEVSTLPEDLGKSSRKGLEDLYDALEEPEKTILLYLDMPDPPQSLLIHHGANKSLTPLNVLKPLYTLCKAQDIPVSLAVWFNELYKLNLVKGHPVMEFAQERGLKALYITGSQTSPQTLKNEVFSGISAEGAAEVFADYAGSLTISQDNLDYHFLILRFWEHYFFISEITTVKLFFLVITLFFIGVLIYGIIRRKTLILQWQIFFTYLWVFPLFLVSLVLTLEIAGSLVDLTNSGFENASLRNDFGWGVFKIIIAMILLTLLFSFWNMLKIPRKAVFYGNAAVILVVVGVFIAAVLDITFVPLFIWILLFTWFGSVTTIPALVYACALLVPFQSIGPLFNLLQVHSNASYIKEKLLFSAGRLTEIILSRNIDSTLYIAVITLPFILLIERGTALIQEKNIFLRKGRRFFPVLAVLFLVFGALAFYTHKLRTIAYMPPVRRISEDKNILQVKLNYVTFLERRNITINLEALGNPQRFNLYLESTDETPPVIYAAYMPFAFINDQKAVAFTLGEGPPNPFSTEIVVPVNFSGALRVEALYTAWDPDLDTMARPESGDYVLQVVKTIKIGS
ncbi:MAG: hypothetical protein LBD29_03780 [Treponema sp.]|jgi:hypothetical protein|nr:hypothetical protein [Treponema sp.]